MPKFSQDALYVYDTTSWQAVSVLQIPSLKARALAISPDGQFATLAGQIIVSDQPIKQQLTIVDVTQAKIVRSIETSPPMYLNYVAWSPNGAHIVAAGGYGMQIFDARSGAVEGNAIAMDSTRMTLRYTP